MSISFAATPQAKEGQQTRAYTDDVSAGAPPSRRTGYDRPYVNRDHWNKVFTQPEYFDSIAKQKGMVEGAKVSLHGDDYVYRQAMMGYLSATRNVPLDDMRSVFDAEKDGFAQKVLGKKTATARELFDWHKTKFERENEKNDAARTIIEDVTRNSLQDAMLGGDTPFVESVTQSIAATGDMFTEEEKSRLWEKAEEQDKKIRATQAAIAPEARFLFSALGQITGQQAGMGAPDMREVAGKFAQLPDNQRKAIYELAGGFAQLQKTDKGFWYQLAESLGRGTAAFTEGIPRNFREQTLRGQLRLLESEQPVFRATGVAGAEFSAAGSTPATPEEREQAKAKIQFDLGILKVEREIRDLAERVVDPIKTVTFLPEIVEEGLYGAAQSIPYTVAAAIPYVGMPAVASALFSANYDSIMLQYDGIDPDKAALIAAISAPIEAVLERMKVNTITGRLPVFGGLVKRLQHPNQRNLTRIMIGAGGVLAEQNLQEIVQGLTFPVVQTIAAAIDQDMRQGLDVEKTSFEIIGRRLENYPRELAVQFVALLPLSLMGMGALSHREMTRGADYIRNKSNLERMGYGEDQIDRITGAATADEAQTILQDEHGKRDPELVKAAAKRVLDEVLALREQKAPASLPRLEKQGADYVVLSPEGRELARSTDQTVAEQALVSARRETVQREMRDVHTGINEAVEFIQKVNEARQRGEDVAEVIRERSPRTLLTDYEANPTQENLDRLYETVRAFGQDINEPAELANFPVIGSNQGALAEGIWRSVIRINEGADGTIVMREFAQDNLKRAISEGRTTMDFVRQQLNDVLPQIDSNRIKRQLRTDTDTDVIEAFSDVALAYFRGSIREEQIPAGLRGIMRRLAIISRDIFRRAYNLARLRAEGKLDRDFEALLAEAVGVNQQALVDRARERTEQEVGAGQNYSISLVGQYVKAKRAIEDSPLAEQDGSVKRGAIGYVDDYDSTNNLLYVDFGNGAIAVDPSEVTATANPNYSIGISPTMDTDYLAAVERGDMEMAQRMVDDAARRKAITNTTTAINGDIAVILGDGTNQDAVNIVTQTVSEVYSDLGLPQAVAIVDFKDRTSASGEVFGAYEGEAESEQRTSRSDVAFNNYLFRFPPHDISKVLDSWAEDIGTLPNAGLEGLVAHEMAHVAHNYIRYNREESDLERIWSAIKELSQTTSPSQYATTSPSEWLAEQYAQEFITKQAGPATQFLRAEIAAAPILKSVAPVTYDASGNVIPLSQRFDATTADINYSIGLRPDVISQVSDRDDGSRVGTAKLGTDKVPVDTPQTSNISGDTVPEDLLAKQMAKVDYAHLPDSIRNESDPKKKRRKLINWFKKNLLALHDAFPEEVRARATHWYDGANRIAREFGQRFNATVEQASGVIAVFSPQKDWFMNVAQAMQFMELWTTSQDVVLSEKTVRAEVEDIIEAATAPQRQKRKKAPDETKEQAAERKAYNQQLDQKAKDERRTTLDKIIGKTVRELDDQPYLQGWAIRVLAQVTFGRNYRNISPEGEMLGMATNDDGALAKNGWGSINEIEKAVRIMKDGALANISNNLGNEHKVRNFYNNIVAPNSGFGDATIDTHAVAAAHLMPYGAKATEVQHNFGSGMNSSDAMGVSGLYHVYLDAYREAAKERGLQPRQLQSITWEAIRLVYPAANKNAATLAKAAQTWNSLSDGRARNSLVGGTIPNPVWAGTGNVAESQSLAGSTEGDGQGSDAGRGLRAGDRSDGRQGVDNYSISTQSEIDRVQKAMDRLARSPSERISQYAALKERLAAALERNQPIMQSMRGDTLPQDFDRTRLLNDLGFLDYILKVLPPEVRGRVGGYTNLAAISPVDVYKGDQKVSEAKNPAGAIISAWMREGQNIGQAQKNTALPEGYSTVANTTDERRDKTVANFLIDRLKKIDRELERYYKRDLMERIFDVLDKSRPKAGQSGVKRSTLGAETQKFADMVYRSSLLDDEKTAERLTAIEAEITGIQPRDSSPEAFAESQKRISELSEEWTIVNTFGDLKSRPSETLAYGLEWLQGQLKAGRSAWQIKEVARIQENRERAAKVVAFLGKPTDVGRFENKSTLQRFLEAVNAYDLDHKSFEQFAPYLFGEEVAAELSKKMQRAQIDEAKAELENMRSILAAIRQGAKAAGMSTGKALVAFKENQSKAVRKLEGRRVKDTKISIELAKKIVRGLADRGSLSQADVQTLADELAALPRDTKKEFVTIKQVIFRGEEVRLTMSRAQAMQLWLTWQQRDAQKKMRADGFNDDSFDDLDNLISGPFSQAILRVTSRIYGSGYALTNPIYARMFGMNMPMVKNYAPARYQSNKEVKDVGLDGSPLTAGGQPSFAKSRVNHTAKLAPEDALTVLQSHIAMQSHWVAFAEVAREYRSLLSNPDVRESIRQRLGKDVLRSADMWGDQMEQRGGNKGREIAWINNMLGAVIGGQSVSLLGYNLKSLMMQTDNFMRFFLALDSRQIGSALSDPVALMQSVRKVWKTDIIQTRLEGGATAETRFFFERFVSMFRRGAKVAEMSMMPMNYLDSAGLSISGAVVYQAAYKDALDSGVDPTSAEQVAKDAVESMVYRYGQPVLMGQKSNIENSGNAFTKAFFLFMSDPRLKMAIISDSVRGLATGRGDWKAHVRRIVAIEMMAVVAHVLATAFRDATSDDDDEDLWSMGGSARALLLAPFQGYFLVGSVSDLVLTRLTEAKWFTPTQNPLIRTADTAMRAFNNIDDAFNFDDPDALVKEWTNITRSIAVTPPLAAPAVIMNLVRPLVQGWEHMVPSIMDKMDGGWKDERVQQDDE